MSAKKIAASCIIGLAITNCATYCGQKIYLNKLEHETSRQFAERFAQGKVDWYQHLSRPEQFGVTIAPGMAGMIIASNNYVSGKK